MSEVALDASALLALLREEPGHKEVRKSLPRSIISTVNIAEVFAKAVEIGIGLDAAIAAIKALPLVIVPFNLQHAVITGSLREATRHLGLSLGDRCCLALGLVHKIPVLTTERAWTELNLDVKVQLIR